jgi:hypothetical protein
MRGGSQPFRAPGNGYIARGRGARCHRAMTKRPTWYDPQTQTSPFLTALAEARLECNRAEHVMPYAKVASS